MLDLTIAYDPATRSLSTASEYAGTVIDNLSAQITVTGIPEGYSARLDFRVKVKNAQGKTIYPYLTLDGSGTCTLNANLLMACKRDLTLPLQLVLTKSLLENRQEVIASANIIVLDVSPAIDAYGTITEAYSVSIDRAFIDIDESDGVITFTRLDGTEKVIHVDDDFIAWADTVEEWPEEPSDDKVPTAKAVDDTFLKIRQTAANRLLVTDADGDITDNGPRIVSAWSPTPSDDNLPTEKLVKDELDDKANDADVVHNNVGTPLWSPSIEYGSGATVVRDLEFYISQNADNLNHDPTEEGTVWWAKVTGSGGGGDDPGAYRVFTIGDGESTEFIVNHQFNSYHVAHLLYTTGGTRRDSDTTVERTSKNHIKVAFNTAPASGEYTMVVYRPGIGPESCVTTINGQTGDVIFTPSDFDAVGTEPEQGLTQAQQGNARTNIGLGTASVLDAGTGAGNLPPLNADGKLPNSVIPALGMTDYLGNVSTKAQLVTLTTGEQGDWATVSDDPVLTNNGAWSLNGVYSDIDDWVQISGPGTVLSVNGKVAVVVLDADDVDAVAKRTAITAGTKCKITFAEDGLVTGGEDLAAADIPSLPASKIDSGTINIARLPTGNAANKVVKLGETLVNGQSVLWDESSQSFIPYTPSTSTLAVFTGTITGDGATTVFSFNHGLNGVPVPTLIDGNGRVVSSTIETTATTLTVTFYSAPENGETYTIKAIA